MTQKAIRCVVSGRVQGVGFRYFVQRAATSLGLKGWVRNLDGGNVEFLVQGDAQSVDKMLALARTGPQLAWVRDAVVDPQRIDPNLQTFEIKPTAW